MVHGISRLLLCDRGVSNIQLGTKFTIESRGTSKGIRANFLRKRTCSASKDRRCSADDHPRSLKEKIRLGRWRSSGTKTQPRTRIENKKRVEHEFYSCRKRPTIISALAPEAITVLTGLCFF